APLVLDGGPCEVGVESTIVSLVDGPPKLLRPGGVLREDIEALLGRKLEHHQHASTAKQRVSGLLDSHYAPRTTLITGPADQVRAAALAASHAGQRVALITMQSAALADGEIARLVTMPDDAPSYARRIYDTLRQ